MNSNHFTQNVGCLKVDEVIIVSRLYLKFSLPPVNILMEFVSSQKGNMLTG
jgi:hypothetical protein